MHLSGKACKTHLAKFLANLFWKVARGYPDSAYHPLTSLDGFSFGCFRECPRATELDGHIVKCQKEPACEIFVQWAQEQFCFWLGVDLEGFPL